MTQVELDLVEGRAVLVGQLGVGTAQVVGGDLFKAAAGSIFLDHFPDGLCVDKVAQDLAAFAHRLKEAAVSDPGGVKTSIDCLLGPGGEGDRARFVAFAHQVGDHPAAFAQLYVLDGQVDEFLPSKTAPEEDGKHGPVPDAHPR